MKKVPDPDLDLAGQKSTDPTGSGSSSLLDGDGMVSVEIYKRGDMKEKMYTINGHGIGKL